MSRFLFSLALLYFIYYLAKRFFRQLMSPQEKRRPQAPHRGAPRREASRREAPRPIPPQQHHGVDYSKVKDADYRDL